MKYESKFGVGQEVAFRHMPDLHAFVVAVIFHGYGCSYRCSYFHNGEFKTMPFYHFELTPCEKAKVK